MTKLKARNDGQAMLSLSHFTALKHDKDQYNLTKDFHQQMSQKLPYYRQIWSETIGRQ